MTVTAAFGMFVLPAVVFALAYFPLVTRLSRGLLSPYTKADVTKRLFAATLDALLVTTTGALYWSSQSVLFLVAGAAYLLLRDAVAGQSVGKFCLGLVVISLETGRPSTLTGSIRRNLLLLLPGANVVAVFLEAVTVLRDPQGQRLGDRLAQTQVIEGLGAKDLVKSLQRELSSVGTDLAGPIGRPGRGPVEIDP
jgi:uncharacterized RDD family membrane protein YckC